MIAVYAVVTIGAGIVLGLLLGLGLLAIVDMVAYMLRDRR